MNERDMNAPVTRQELREELANYPTRQELRESLDDLAQRFDAKFAAMLAAMDARFAEMRADMHALIKTTETVLIMRIDASLDPHRGVPERVTKLESEELPSRVRKLESKVFAPKGRTAKRAR